MNLKPPVRKIFLYLFGAACLIAAVTATLRYSGWCTFENVTVDAPRDSGEIQILTASAGENLFAVPVEKAMSDLLEHDDIIRVDLDYDLPDAFRVRFNDIEPVALVLDDNGRTLYRLGHNGYLLPLDSVPVFLDVPLITGLSHCAPYRKTADKRVAVLIQQIRKLHDDCRDFYLTLATIDLSHPDEIVVYLDGLPFCVETYAGALYDSIRRLMVFLLEFNPGLKEIRKLNMKSEGLIIAAG